MTPPAPGPAEGRTPPGRVTPLDRQRVVDILCDAYAADWLGMAELERRLDRANRVQTGEELADLVGDLDLNRLKSGGRSPVRREGGDANVASVSPDNSRGGSLARIDAARVPERQLSVAFWSARSRKGTWVPARRISAVALQGGIELDFREAAFGPGAIEVQAVAFMGAVDIIVPPELHVETSGFAILGAFEDDAGPSGPPDPEAPVLRLTGFAFMGAVDVQVRLPGETARQARARRRKERREKR